MPDRYIIGGLDSEALYLTFGIGAFDELTNPESAHAEFFHPNTLRGVASEMIQVEADVPLTNGVGSVTGRLRGPGNFCLFRKATFDRPGTKIEIFRDIDLTEKVAEFEN